MLGTTHVLGPLRLPGIHGAGQHELHLRIAPRRLQEQFVHFGLAIGCVGGHVTQVAGELGARFHARVVVRVYASVKRPRHTHAVLLLQLLEDLSSNKREHQVEGAKLVAAQVIDAACSKVAQRNRCIQVVENAQRAVEIQHFIVDAPAFGQIAGGDDSVGRAGIVHRAAPDVSPVFIESETAIVASGEIAADAVVLNVLLEEVHLVAGAAERTQNGAVGSGVAVTPRRRDGQAKDSDLHFCCCAPNRSRICFRSRIIPLLTRLTRRASRARALGFQAQELALLDEMTLNSGLLPCELDSFGRASTAKQDYTA